MWTMHDYPWYGDASNHIVQEYHECPTCGPKMQAQYNRHLKKMVYKGHCKFFSYGSLYERTRTKTNFWKNDCG